MKESSVFEWLELLEAQGAEDVEIRHREKFTINGVRQYSPALPARAVNIRKRSYSGREHTQTQIVWLLTGSFPEAAPGDLLIHHNIAYEISQVENCRNLAGETVARRCSTL